MFGSLLAPLLATLRPHFNLSKTRLETLAVLLLGLANSRTVNLSHLASQVPRPCPARFELPPSTTVLPACAAQRRQRRWAVECLFADARTRGLNIEDTHITHPDKLATLLVVVALAVTWAYQCATKTMGRKTMRRKTHARREKSWFRTGLDALRNWILYQPQKALQAWTQTDPKRPINTLQS